MCRQLFPSLFLSVIGLLLSPVAHLSGQVMRGPSTSPMPANMAQQNGMSPAPPAATYPSSNPPSLSLGNPTYDPYHSGANPGVFAPALPYQQPVPPSATVPGGSTLRSLFGGWTGSGVSGSTTGYTATSPAPMLGGPTSYPPAAYPPAGYPPAGYGGAYPGAGYPQTGYPAGVYPDAAYPNSGPPVLFPGGGLGGGYAGGGYGGGNYYNPIGEFAMPGAFKFLQGPRFSHGWLGGGEDARDLGVNETQVSIAFAFPNFLWSGQPIYVLPSFSLDLWEGPKNITADLPSSAYEAFLDAGWQTDPNQILGLELGTRVGVFTDFDTFNSDSIRIMGTALGKFRLTPRATLKAGVMYIDRLEVKLIPAGGLLWQPTPYSRWDIYFPSPKVSHYFRTVGTQDIWWYVAGEYGGGSWTISRTNGVEDRVDINDFRVFTGFEWGRGDAIRAGRRTGFIEGGWVFGREVVYETTPGSFDPEPTFMLRAGIGY